MNHMHATDPADARRPSSGMRTYNVEVMVSYRRVFEVVASCPEHAEETAIQHLEDMAPRLIEDAAVICEVQ